MQHKTHFKKKLTMCGDIMKFLTTIILGLSLSTLSFAEEAKQVYKQINAEEAEVTVTLTEEDFGQTATYVDGAQNEKFIEQLLKDKNSKLFALKAQIEKENCEENSTDENPWIDGCGQVEVTKEVLTSFGRGGWAGAGAYYTFFLGFRSAGTGRFFETTHMVQIMEDVNAVTKDDGEFAGQFIKTLKLETIKKL